MQETLGHLELYRNIAIVISMALFVIFGISRVIYPKLFVSIYSFGKFLTFKYRDDFGSGIRLFSTESFYFTAVLSLTLSFSITCFYLFTPNFQAYLGWYSIDSLISGLLFWIVLAFGIQFLFFLKYIFIRIFGWLFGLPLEQSRHFLEYQSMNNSFSIIIYVLISFSVYLNYSFPKSSLSVLGVLVCIYVIFRLINLFFKIRNLGAYSNLYIFSYLCSTELIPTLIGLNLFV